MKTVLGILLVFLVGACGKNNIKPKELVGKWENAYERKTKDEKGEWTGWTPMTNYILLPSLEFTSDGDILSAGETPTGCCTFTKYVLKGKTIKLSVPPLNASCAAINCLSCSYWSIVSISDSVLELNRCDVIIERYRRAD